MQAKKVPMISRIRDAWRNRKLREQEFKVKDVDELDNSHRSSRHAVTLEQISQEYHVPPVKVVDELDNSHRSSRRTVTLDDLNLSKSTAAPTEETSLTDASERERRSYETSGSSDALGTVPAPICIEEESEDKEERKGEEAEPEERVLIKGPLVLDPEISNSERHVRFSTVEIREYPICMGDNPGSSRGIPITIGWEIVDETVQKVDIHQYRPRTKHQLHHFRLSPLDRVLLLKRQGYSGGEIREGTDKVDRFRAQRKRTTSWLWCSGAHEVLENLQRSFLNSTIHRSRKRQEREFLYEYKSELSTPFQAASYTFRAPPKLRDSIHFSGGTNIYLD